MMNRRSFFSAMFGGVASLFVVPAWLNGSSASRRPSRLEAFDRRELAALSGNETLNELLTRKVIKDALAKPNGKAFVLRLDGGIDVYEVFDCKTP